MKNATRLIALLSLAGLAALSQAQTATPAPAPTATPTKADIAQRKDVQQDRIANGVASGQLTPKETAHLENQQANINKTERADKAADDGKLTKQDRRQLTKMQNHASKNIAKDKHNDAVGK